MSLRWALSILTAAALSACSANDSGADTGTGADFDAGRGDLDAGDAAANDDESERHDAETASSFDGGVTRIDDAAMGCVKGTYTAKARPLDMFILLDQSGSMQEDEDRWTPVTKAIKRFVANPDLAGTGVALQYFPLGRDDAFKCEGKNYELPDVPMAALPQNAHSVSASIDAHYFSHDECCDTPEHAGTPTRPAMEGAVAYMRSHMQKNPDHVGVILLATDGEPSSVCDENKASHVATVVRSAAQGTPSIRTYVIGIGDDEYLDDMAEPGGTGRGPFIVDDTGQRTESELAEALAAIRNAALPCDYAVSNVVDSTRLNVETTENAGSTRTLVNVPNAEGCSKADQKGWYYDDPKAPKRVQLCPDTCSQLAELKATTVRVVEGCETVVLL